MKVQKVLLSRIDTESEGWDDFILDTQPANVDRLAESLERVGQIHPLVLRKDMDWLFFVCGWARYLAMKKIGVEEAWARIYQKNELSDERALWISVENDCCSPFSPAKQKRVINLFKNIGYSPDKIAQSVAPAIGLAPTVEAVTKALEL
jgi:hypothetical protein